MADFLTDESFEKFRILIYNESGITFSASNRMILESRLRERLKIANLPDVEAYYKLIRSNQSELHILLDAVTTNLTRFFRNTPHFQTFEYFVIPEIIKLKRKSGDRTFRLWSAGCSTGEEPYSLAMVLKDLVPPDISIQITASDISLKSVMTAREGYYPENRMAGVPEKYLTKYFEKKASGYQVVDGIKKLVKFDFHNLKHDSGQRNLDCVFCRNVIIYFDAINQKEVIERFWDALAPESFLFIGHSESLFGMNTKFTFLKTDWACIYKKG